MNHTARLYISTPDNVEIEKQQNGSKAIAKMTANGYNFSSRAWWFFQQWGYKHCSKTQPRGRYMRGCIGLPFTEQSLWSTTWAAVSIVRNTSITFSQNPNLYLCLLFSSRSAAVATLCLVSLEATTRCTTASSSGTCSASMNFTIPSLHYSTMWKVKAVLLTRKRVLK